MKILNLSECTEKLDITEISPKEIEKYNYHILHGGEINKQTLDYIVYNTKVIFEEIKKLLTFDFARAEKGESVIVVNGIALRKENTTANTRL